MTLPVGNYTFYTSFENCPHKAFRIYVAKDLPRQEKTKEQAYGNHVHDSMDLRLGRGEPLPDDLKAMETLARELEALPSEYPQRTEHRLAFKENGTPCEWFGAGEWFRIKIDWHVRMPASAWILDWKTGKVREEPLELECASLALKINYPELAHIAGEYFWTQEWRQGVRFTLNNWSRTFARLQKIRNEIEQCDREGRWPKHKNPLCAWCPVGPSAPGGQCEHWRPTPRR
jgi:hypothetical protein